MGDLRMTAQYRVTFNDGNAVYVYSVDAKSVKKADVDAANLKACTKALAAAAKKYGAAPRHCVDVRCIG